MVDRLLERIGVELPLFQAGMGGGIAGHELAAAVSEAGGLGTIGILDPPALREEIAAGRRLTEKPIAVNLLLPFAGPLTGRQRVRQTSWSPSGDPEHGAPIASGSTSAGR